MKKCLVTGATGHIGNVLIRKLLKQGYEVSALVRKTSELSPLEGLNVKILYGEITDRDKIFSVIEKDMYVFHLAGMIDISSKKPYRNIINVNFEGTKNIVDACIKNGASKLIYTSTVHIIEEKNKDKLTEPENLNYDNLDGAYAQTKLMATKYVLEESKKHNFFSVVVYPSGVIGPYDYKISELGQVILDYMNHKLPFYVRGGYNFVDVRDVADGIILASQKGRMCEDYILSGEAMNLRQMMTVLNERLGRKRYPITIPVWIAKCFSVFSNLYYKARNKKPVFSSYSLTVLRSNCNFDNIKAKKELGYNPMAARTSLIDSVDWFYENKKDMIKK